MEAFLLSVSLVVASASSPVVVEVHREVVGGSSIRVCTALMVVRLEEMRKRRDLPPTPRLTGHCTPIPKAPV